MKKLFLLIPFIVLMLFFTVLNYLLWDRQNKLIVDSSKDSTIAALGREIKNMESSNNLLRDKSNKLETDLKNTEAKINELNLEKSKLQQSIQQKDEIIGQLRQTADLQAPEAVLKNWLENLSKGQLDAAYQLQTSTLFGQQMTQEEFSKQFKAKVKSINVNSINVVLQTSEEKKGDILYKVSLEISRVPDTGKFIFDDGKNDKLFSLIYSKEKNSWIISQIE